MAVYDNLSEEVECMFALANNLGWRIKSDDIDILTKIIADGQLSRKTYLVFTYKDQEFWINISDFDVRKYEVNVYYSLDVESLLGTIKWLIDTKDVLQELEKKDTVGYDGVTVDAHFTYWTKEKEYGAPGGVYDTWEPHDEEGEVDVIVDFIKASKDGKIILVKVY